MDVSVRSWPGGPGWVDHKLCSVYVRGCMCVTFVRIHQLLWAAGRGGAICRETESCKYVQKNINKWWDSCERGPYLCASCPFVSASWNVKTISSSSSSSSSATAPGSPPIAFQSLSLLSPLSSYRQNHRLTELYSEYKAARYATSWNTMWIPSQSNALSEVHEKKKALRLFMPFDTKLYEQLKAWHHLI